MKKTTQKSSQEGKKVPRTQIQEGKKVTKTQTQGKKVQTQTQGKKVQTQEEGKKVQTQEEGEASSSKRRKIDIDEDGSILMKISQQNTRILDQLNTVISGQKEIRNRLTKIEQGQEKKHDDIHLDPSFLKNFIKDVANNLVLSSLYPTNEELRDSAYTFISENHSDLYRSTFKTHTEWLLYYSKQVASSLLSKHRSCRGSIASKIKDALTFVFRELPPIPTVKPTLLESDIRSWKGDPNVKNCYNKLFKRINAETEETYMSLIIKKMFQDRKNAPKIHIAFTISACELLLDPSNLCIQLSEELVKPKLIKNLQKLKNENFDTFEEEDEEKEEENEEKGDEDREEVEKEVEKEVEEEGGSQNEEGEGGSQNEEGPLDYYSEEDQKYEGVMKELKKKYKQGS